MSIFHWFCCCWHYITTFTCIRLLASSFRTRRLMIDRSCEVTRMLIAYQDWIHTNVFIGEVLLLQQVKVLRHRRKENIKILWSIWFERWHAQTYFIMRLIGNRVHLLPVCVEFLPEKKTTIVSYFRFREQKS